MRNLLLVGWFHPDGHPRGVCQRQKVFDHGERMIKKGTGVRQATENRKAPLPPLMVLMDAGVRKDRYWRIPDAGVESVSGEL